MADEDESRPEGEQKPDTISVKVVAQVRIFPGK